MTIDEDVFVKHKDMLGAALAVGTVIVGVSQTLTWAQLEMRQNQLNAKLEMHQIQVNAQFAAVNTSLAGLKESVDKLANKGK